MLSIFLPFILLFSASAGTDDSCPLTNSPQLRVVHSQDPMIISGKTSLLFFKGAHPDADLIERASQQKITFIYDKAREVMVIVCEEGLSHQTLLDEYLPEGAEVLGGTRYEQENMINSKTLFDGQLLDGIAVHRRYFHDAFFIKENETP